MNNENKKLLDELIYEGTVDGAQLPEAYAIAKMVELAVKNKTYKVYRVDENIQTFDIIATFFSVDPVFGLYFEDNGDGESVIGISKPDGVDIKYLD